MSLADLKRRINTVKNTGKITKAMSLISAAQLSKAKNFLASYTYYVNLMSDIMCNISYGARKRFDTELIIPNDLVVQASQKFLDIHEDYHEPKKRKLLIVISASKGLCGAFNSAIVNKTISELTKNTDVFCIGKKGYELLSKNKKRHVNILYNKYVDINFKKLKTNILMNTATKKILKLIACNTYESIDIIYTQFVSMLSQEVVLEKIFPIHYSNTDEIAFDRNPTHMLIDIIPHYLNSLLYNCILSSVKSESAKRMITMDNASKNSTDMTDSLTLKYNKARKEKVTKELIEIISGTTA